MENLAHSASLHSDEETAPSNAGIKHLGFSMVIKDAQSVLDAVAEHIPDDLGENAQEEAARLGLQAWEIADRLRAAHKLDPVQVRFKYVGLLRREIAKAEKRNAGLREQFLERSAEIARQTED